MHAEIKKEKIHICEMTNVFSGREGSRFFSWNAVIPLLVQCPALSPLLMNSKVYGLLA